MLPLLLVCNPNFVHQFVNMIAQISTQAAQESIEQNPENVVIDVRTPMEWNEGIIPGALTINIMDPQFVSRLEPLDRGKSYIIVCRSGGRSLSACQAMASMGFTDVSNMLGGMSHWQGPVAEYH